MVKPLDTSTLGPIHINPNELALRARIVREALQRVARDAVDVNVANGADLIATHADDETLRLIRRLIA